MCGASGVLRLTSRDLPLFWRELFALQALPRPEPSLPFSEDAEMIVLGSLQYERAMSMPAKERLLPMLQLFLGDEVIDVQAKALLIPQDSMSERRQALASSKEYTAIDAPIVENPSSICTMFTDVASTNLRSQRSVVQRYLSGALISPSPRPYSLV